MFRLMCRLLVAGLLVGGAIRLHAQDKGSISHTASLNRLQAVYK